MELSEQFKQRFLCAPTFICSAAGRVNLIGEHIDYCGGRVLPAALSLKCRVAARPNGTHLLRVAATDLEGVCEIDLRRIGEYRHLKWGSYQAGVASELLKEGYRLSGCDMLFECTVPFGAGLSSSAAIEVAAAYALARLGGNPIDKVRLAVLCRNAENNYCNVNCGIMDQFASANGKAGHAVLLDCADLTFEYVPLDLKDCVLVLSNCNKPHSLVTSKYNERRRETDEALLRLKERLPAERLADIAPSALEENRDLLSETLYRRARHVVTECARVEESVRALKEGDLPAFGKLLNASHISLRDDYEATGKELDALAEAAWKREECLGSRMTGAGFGGSTVSLVRREKTEDFIRAVGKEYAEKIGHPASFFVAEIADGITEEEL